MDASLAPRQTIDATEWRRLSKLKLNLHNTDKQQQDY